MYWQTLLYWFQQFLHLEDDSSDGGQGLVEYALILIFVAVVVVAIASVLGPGIGNIYSNLVTTLGS